MEMSSEFVWKYVFSTENFGDISEHLLPALNQLLYSSFDVAKQLVKLFLVACIVTAKLFMIIFPHAIAMTNSLVEFHRTQLSTKDMIIEFSVIFLGLSLCVFWKRIKQLWKSLEQSIAVKSKRAAKAAPHVLFFSCAIALSVVGNKLIAPLASFKVMPLISLAIPALSTTRHLCSSEISTLVHNRRHVEKAQRLLVLWIVLGTYHAAATLLSLMPFSHKFIAVMPYLREFLVISLIWAQLSPIFANILLASTLPVLTLMIKRLPTVPLPQSISSQSAAKQQGVFLISSLKMMRLINSSHEKIILGLLQDGLVTVCLIVFLLTPAPICHLGAVVVALLFPTYKAYKLYEQLCVRVPEDSGLYKQLETQTMRQTDNQPTAATASLRRSRFGLFGYNSKASSSKVVVTKESSVSELHGEDGADDSKFNKDKKHVIKRVVDEEVEEILCYWACLSVIWLLRTSGGAGGPFRWASVTMLTALWLQHSYLRGGITVARWLSSTRSALSARHTRVIAEKLQPQLLQQAHDEPDASNSNINNMAIVDQIGSINTIEQQNEECDEGEEGIRHNVGTTVCDTDSSSVVMVATQIK